MTDMQHSSKVYYVSSNLIGSSMKDYKKILEALHKDVKVSKVKPNSEFNKGFNLALKCLNSKLDFVFDKEISLKDLLKELKLK